MDYKYEVKWYLLPKLCDWEWGSNTAPHSFILDFECYPGEALAQFHTNRVILEKYGYISLKWCACLHTVIYTNCPN